MRGRTVVPFRYPLLDRATVIDTHCVGARTISISKTEARMDAWKRIRWTTLAVGIILVPAARAAKPPGPTLNVFAAASLADAFGDLAAAFETAHPGTPLPLNPAGSQHIA